MISSNYFSINEKDIFNPIIENLMNTDYYCVFADYESHIDTQDRVSDLYRNTGEWTKKSILNVARAGKFSSDRSIFQYAENIWKISPVKIENA